jgi:hypothetical protein
MLHKAVIARARQHLRKWRIYPRNPSTTGQFESGCDPQVVPL